MIVAPRGALGATEVAEPPAVSHQDVVHLSPLGLELGVNLAQVLQVESCRPDGLGCVTRILLQSPNVPVLLLNLALDVLQHVVVPIQRADGLPKLPTHGLRHRVWVTLLHTLQQLHERGDSGVHLSLHYPKC